MRVPAMATDDPMMEPVDMGVLKAMTEATMMTTRLMVLPTAWVTGLTCVCEEKDDVGNVGEIWDACVIICFEQAKLQHM